MNYNSIQNITKSVDILISKNKFDEAREEIKQIRNLDNFSKYQMEYELLKRKINEASMTYAIETSSLKDKYNEFIRMGKLSIYYCDYYMAYQCYMAGAYLTNLPDFHYKAAKAMFFSYEHEKAIILFNKYIETGYSKLSKSYYYLLKCENGISPDKRKKIFKRKDKLDFALSTIGDYQLIKEYGFRYNEGFKDFKNEDIDIKDITSNFELYSDLEKLKAIRLLYQNNYSLLADKYLKKFYRNHSNDEVVIKQFKQLQLNRTLYVNQEKK